MSLSIFSFEYLRDLRSAFARRGKRVLVLICLFLMILILGMRLLWSIFFFENFQVMAVKTLSSETAVLGIGSSRMFYGIDPRKMPGSYVSLAANYLDMKGAERLWKKFSEDLPALKLVFIELSVSTLFYDMEVLAPQALQPLGLDIFPEASDFLFRPDHAFRLLLSPIYRWRMTPDFLASYFETMSDVDEPHNEIPGFIPSKLILTQPQLFAERKVAQTREHMANFGTGIFQRNLDSAKRLAQALQHRGVRTVFLRFPMDKHVWPVFEQEWSNKVQSAFIDIKSDVVNATFIDLSHSPEFLSDEFRDPDHLNAKGALRYTNLVAPIASAELTR
jgi:hypothetical protein